MKHEPPKGRPDRTRSSSASSQSRSLSADSLTPAQQEFARLLGRLLAELWERERYRSTPPRASD
jgi:hypothetical protein